MTGAAGGALHVGAHPPRVGLGALWFGVLAGPAVWSLLTIVNYAVAAQSCAPADVQLPRPLFDGVRVFAGVLTLVGFAIVIAALVTAIRSHRTAYRPDMPDDAVSSRVRFMALAGIIVSAVFLVAVLLHGLGVVLVRAC